MPDLRRWTSCKFLAVLLSLFFVLEMQALNAQQVSALAERQDGFYESARRAYFAGDYEGAKTILERLIEDLETTEGRDTFKGETFLLAGATYEKLDSLGMSVKYYCRARAILGEGISIEGLNLKTLKYYACNCAAIDAVLLEMSGQTDELVGAYNQARIGYFAGATEAAKVTLESLITSLGAIEGRDTFKGQVYLLAGAVYEAQQFRELAIKYYCRAKAILGEGTTIEGLELKDLAYYGEPCGTAAVAGTAVKTSGRKRGFFGGLIGTLLGLAIIGGLVWYLFFSKNAPLGKKGKYTKITFRLDVTYKGFNSRGHRRLKIGGETKNDEDFIYPQMINQETPCSAATKSESHSYTHTIASDSVVMNQDWIDWDYNTFNPSAVNWKKLCADYTITIVSYEYEKGRDPGKPSASGVEGLQISSIGDCTEKSVRVHDCFRTATISFSPPADASAVRQASSALVEMSDRK